MISCEVVACCLTGTNFEAVIGFVAEKDFVADGYLVIEAAWD